MTDTDGLDEKLSDFLKEDSVTSEQREFNELSNKAKLERLNRLIQQTEIYSQIILDNMLEKSLEKQKEQKRQNKLKKRELRRKKREKYEEKKKLAAEMGEPEPAPPSESESDLSDDEEIADDEASREHAEVEKNATDSEKEDFKPESDSDLEVVEVLKVSRKRKGKAPKRLSKRLQKEKPKKKTRERELVKPKQESSEKTRETRKALESAQTAHNQAQPSLVSGCTMKDYQLDGLEWLVTLYENGLNGILADEMGLGKTPQCISLICYLIEHKVKGPFLIVAPLSTVNNWCREFAAFAPEVEVIKYTGVKEDRQEIKFSRKLRQAVVVTSYELAIKDFRKISRISWGYLTVDEGHRLKNFECLLIQKLKRLDAANRLLLTGTPLQNNLNELWSLLNFILPDIFSDLELFQLWFNFEEFASEGKTEQDKLIQEDVKQKLVKSLHSILKPFLLRRLKKNVIKDLPPKKEYIVYADLTPLQRAFYASVVQGGAKNAVIELHAKELLIKNHPEQFTRPEHLDHVTNVLYGPSIVDVEEEEKEQQGRKLRKNRKQRFSKRDMRLFETNADLIEPVSDEDFDDEEIESDHNKANEKVIPHRLVSNQTLTGEDLQKEIERQTLELEQTLMLGMMEDGVQTVGSNGPLLRFVPKDQEVREVRTDALDWPQNQIQNGETNQTTPNGSHFNNSSHINGRLQPNGNTNGHLHEKIYNTLEEVITNVRTSSSVNGNGISKYESKNRTKEDPKSSADPVKPKKRRLPRKTKVIKNATPSDSESDIEIIEIKDDSDLTEDEKRRMFAEEAVAIARKHAINLHLQNLVMQLRKVCGSHYTFYNPYYFDIDLENPDDDIVSEYLQLIVKHSGKIQLLKQLLDRLIPEGHKVLIFSQFQIMLDVLGNVLHEKGIAFNRLDGQTKQDEREKAMMEFREDAEDSSKVFLLSTRAGGLGLNLISADTVILFDSDWNPQMDLQAIDRVHRIGQTKPVKIFRLVVRNSIEELLVVKSFSKRLLERMVIELGEFQLGRVAKKLAEEEIDLERFTSIKDVLDIGSRLDLYGAHEQEFTMLKSSTLLLAPPPTSKPLTPDEMDELMDRSKECYAKDPLVTKFPNVTAFQSTNSVEEEEKDE